MADPHTVRTRAVPLIRNFGRAVVAQIANLMSAASAHFAHRFAADRLQQSVDKPLLDQ
jgi:hypothetical protein